MIRHIMSRHIDDPVPLMRALQQLSAQSRQCDLASIYFHLGRDLGSRHLLQSEPADMQIAVRLDRKQGRRAQRVIRIGIRIQDAMPRTLGWMRREPFGEISGGKLVGRQIELKHTSWSRARNGARNDGRSGTRNDNWAGGWSGAMAGRRNFPTPMSASRPRGNLIHSYCVRIESYG